MIKLRSAAAALAVAALTLTACGSGSDGQQPAASGQPRVLKLWHYESADGAMGNAWAEAIKKFEATHPGVTVKFEEKGFEQIQKTASMVLNSDEAPDVMEYNKGNATAGLLSKQGLLTDLTEQATKRGWDKLLSASLQTTAKYDEPGIMGSGKWFGVPNYGEYVMVYYNKDLFEKHGVAVPTTFDEFDRRDGQVRQGRRHADLHGRRRVPGPADLLPARADARPTGPGWTPTSSTRARSTSTAPSSPTRADTFADWVKKGYIAKDSAGIKAEDMGIAFIGGKFPIMVSGSWWYGRFATEIKNFQWGTFLLPGQQATPGSSGNIWVVPRSPRTRTWPTTSSTSR